MNDIHANDDVLRKIKKCLKLSQSANEHEAAAALRQAQALMRKHSLDQADVAASEIGESESRSGGLSRPAGWEARLAAIIAKAFKCKCLHRRLGMRANWVFIGKDPAPAIAAHTFTQLFRQLKKARADFIGNSIAPSASKSVKAKRADFFCEGWINAVLSKIELHAHNEDQEAIDFYVKKNAKINKSLSTTDRISNANVTRSDALSYYSGKDAGDKAQLHHGVDGSGNAAGLIESA